MVAEMPPGERIEPFRKKIALVVGIDKYKNGVRPLNVAVQDARAVHNLLRYDLGFDKVILLENEKARRHYILHNIAQLRDETSAEDQLVFFFAGHGVSFGEGSGELAYLLPQDTEGMAARDVIPSAISMSDLRDHLVKLPPKHILLIFDACFGGYAAASTRAPTPQNHEFLVSLTQYPARQIVTAGLRGQTVVENTEWGHGALTFELLRALRDRLADSNRDGLVTATELISYLKPAVTELTEGRQTPLLTSLTPDSGEFVFLLPDDSSWAGRPRVETLRGESLTEVQERYAEAFPPDVSPDGIQAKAIITEAEATLFTDFHGEAGSRTPFLGTLFLHRGARNGRVPVALGPHRRYPEGWLREGSFTVWATDRILVPTWADKAEVFDNFRCLQEFASPSRKEACRPVAVGGTESGRSNAPTIAFPVLETRGDLAKVGFLIVDPAAEVGQEAGSSARQIGYDLVVALDTTQGMERWFEPLTKAFERFFLHRSKLSPIGPVRPFGWGFSSSVTARSQRIATSSTLCAGRGS